MNCSDLGGLSLSLDGNTNSKLATGITIHLKEPARYPRAFLGINENIRRD
jgi:hypothetical protein